MVFILYMYIYIERESARQREKDREKDEERWPRWLFIPASQKIKRSLECRVRNLMRSRQNVGLTLLRKAIPRVSYLRRGEVMALFFCTG